MSKNVLNITAANTKKIEANKLAQETNLSFIQDDLEPTMVKHQMMSN